jgi:hypothetical protein
MDGRRNWFVDTTPTIVVGDNTGYAVTSFADSYSGRTIDGLFRVSAFMQILYWPHQPRVSNN